MIKYITPLILIIFLYTSLCLPDFRSGEKIAPGVIYYHDHHSSGPWHIHVLEIDMNNSAITLESVKAENSLFARRQTSMMSEEMNSEDHYIVGAINADFFEWNGTPVGAQVINGLLINEPISRSVFGVTVDKKPFIEIVSWKGKLFITKEVVYEIEGLNRRREESELILFNSYYNADTLSLEGGSTTMVVHGAVVNMPSDANGERPVANALMVVNTAPTSSVQTLNIIPDEIILEAGANHQFEVHERDINFHPTNGQIDSIIWSCDPVLGRVDSTGFFTAGTLSRTGYLYVQTGTMVDSARVSIIKNLDNKPLK